MSDETTWTGTLCPQCGWDVAVDEDGCCKWCGVDAVGDGVELALKTRAELARVTAELAAVRHNYGMSIKGYEADLAIYREVLNYAPRWFSQGDGRCDCGHSTCWWCKRWEALSIHAGRSLLSRLEAMEKVVEIGREVTGATHSVKRLHDAITALDALDATVKP